MDESVKLLTARRISSQTIAAFNIRKNGAGWLYPVPGGGQRWKAFNNHSQPKYRWEPAKPYTAALYHAPDVRSAILRAGGACWYVSGEADVWAMHSAAIAHVLSGFGESSVDSALGELLQSLGVRFLFLAPDLDATGERWAAKVASRLDGSGLVPRFYQLPSSLGHKGDLGKAWQEYQGKFPFEQWLLSQIRNQDSNTNQGTQQYETR